MAEVLWEFLITRSNFFVAKGYNNQISWVSVRNIVILISLKNSWINFTSGLKGAVDLRQSQQLQMVAYRKQACMCMRFTIQ